VQLKAFYDDLGTLKKFMFHSTDFSTTLKYSEIKNWLIVFEMTVKQ